jgi:hypothetical protein
MVRLSGSLSRVHQQSASLIDDFVHRAGRLYLSPLLLAVNFADFGHYACSLLFDTVCDC